ncbi:amidohydrolase [Paenactinomyces guangxiensis]|uniref:5-methylthioadenosine/S-adenosylhomocysteine deaminase n=2 Tax=Paenactinomyces guangxiensis TaxID=1490290 RepID=A0A7W1WQZ5_9BACL|nr:amidohydrolase [Paenactinomyces guangxiensis]MBA4494309.1 amidohydrolase [Paenactinomyces guangxiensis]MBH8590803.1 amidohydrolase [Paenactinomyces guangxiensis]
MAEQMGSPIAGDIFIEGQNIRAIGEIPEEIAASASEVIDASGMVAMPGLINTHNHSPMSLLRAFSDDLRLMEWLEQKMLPAEANMSEEDIYWGSLLAIAEMIKSGTTCFADMYIHMDQIARAVKDSGIRASLTRGLIFLEDDGGKRLKEGVQLIEKWTGAAEGRITTMIGPHAPYTCPPRPLKQVIELARDMNVPIHIHLAETEEEVDKIRQKYRQTPTEYLYKLGMFDGSLHVLLAHAVHLSEKDISLIKLNKGGVAHNPTSNLKLGCGIAPVKSYVEQGILVGLGTDGAGSATSLDLFKEINAAAGLQKVIHKDPAALDAGTVLRMATVNGAKLLNIHEIAGSLEIGKKADLILVNMNRPHLMPLHNIFSLLAYAVTGADVDTTIVNGRVLMKNRKLLTIDEDLLFKEVLTRARRIVRGV